MTRKHFQALAEAIATITNLEERKETARLIANVCQDANPQFGRARFLTACGL